MGRPVERVVIDANVAIALAIELPWSASARAKVAVWQSEHAEISVPLFWGYEVISALRKALYAGLLTYDEAEVLLVSIFSIGVHPVEPDLDLHRDALRWASRLGQVVAYDAQYLAVAARLSATFWTADRRLAEKARQCGVDWVRLIAES